MIDLLPNVGTEECASGRASCNIVSRSRIPNINMDPEKENPQSSRSS